MEGLYSEGLTYGGKFAFKIDWASLILGRKFTVFLCFTLYLRASTSPQGGLYLEGRFNGGLFALQVLGAYIWRGLFSEFYGKYSSVWKEKCEIFANLWYSGFVREFLAGSDFCQ